jgi:ATP-dependent DNA helicase RecG
LRPSAFARKKIKHLSALASSQQKKNKPLRLSVFAAKKNKPLRLSVFAAKKIATLLSENQHIEFKSSFNDAVIETVSAFANTKGGKVYVGLDDNGQPLPHFSIGKESIPKWINEIKNKTQPSIMADVELVMIHEKEVICISVSEFPIKPVSFKGRYFQRLHGANHQLSAQEVANLHLKTFGSSWDYYPSPHYDLDSISLDKVAQFIDLANQIREVKIQDDPLTVLLKFELLKNNKQIANACHLLFSKNDLFNATISIGRFASQTSIKDSLVLRTDLFQEVDSTLAFLKKHINKNYIITGNPQREEKWEYPLEALREIVVNMIVHRDYQSAGDAIIKIFDNRIEFYNPGGLENGLTIADLQAGTYTSFARNRKIADVFREAGMIEKYGSGIQRIKSAFVHHGLQVPIFEEFQKGFRVTVFNEVISDSSDNVSFDLIGVSDHVAKSISINVTDDVTRNVDNVTGNVDGVTRNVDDVTGNVDDVTRNVTESRGDKIVQLIELNNRIKTEELALRLGVTKRTVLRDIEKLKKQNILAFRGSTKAGNWELIEHQE